MTKTELTDALNDLLRSIVRDEGYLELHGLETTINTAHAILRGLWSESDELRIFLATNRQAHMDSMTCTGSLTHSEYAVCPVHDR